MKTDASNRSLPELSVGWSFLRDWKSPSDDLKSGIPACTEIPAPATPSLISIALPQEGASVHTAHDCDAARLEDGLDDPLDMAGSVGGVDEKRWRRREGGGRVQREERRHRRTAAGWRARRARGRAEAAQDRRWVEEERGVECARSPFSHLTRWRAVRVGAPSIVPYTALRLSPFETTTYKVYTAGL